MRPIDADALLSMFCEFYTNYERANRLVFSACEIKQMFADMLNETPTIEQPKWIPVTERLPELNQNVLMYFEDNMAVGFWCDTDEGVPAWCAYTDGGWYTDCDMPLYWMPLPQPPKGDE